MEKFDVLGIGNALVDNLAQITANELAEIGYNPGVMTLVGLDDQSKVLDKLGHRFRARLSGGSAANTMIAIASCGGSGHYIGKVGDDMYGRLFKEDMESAGIGFSVAPGNQDSTGTCVVLTTEDAERTMLTHLGISTQLTPKDIPGALIDRAGVVYVEGYMWDSPACREACQHAMAVAKSKQKTVSFTFSDPFVVERYKDDFRELLAQRNVSILFSNEAEMRHFLEIDEQAALDAHVVDLSDQVPLIFVTLGARGAMVIDNGRLSTVGAYRVDAVDTNGAGDHFAAGALYALTQGYSAEKAAKCGGYVASQIVTRFGARLNRSLEREVKSVLESS